MYFFSLQIGDLSCSLLKTSFSSNSPAIGRSDYLGKKRNANPQTKQTVYVCAFFTGLLGRTVMIVTQTESAVVRSPNFRARSADEPKSRPKDPAALLADKIRCKNETKLPVHYDQRSA